MNYDTTLAKLRKEKGYTQSDVAEYITNSSGKTCSFKVVSHWENGVSSPSIEQFLLLCEYYSVSDIQRTFRGIDSKFNNLTKLNALGKSRAEEYISLLCTNPLFSDSETSSSFYPSASGRFIKLFDIPVAAGTGTFLDSESFEELEVDESVPHNADFAVKVSGDSMEPRFVDSQVIFIREQKTLKIGEIGIFSLNGDAFIKKLGQSKLISLNPRYEPIEICEHDSLHVFGKVVG